jgi:arylsulfatase A-like enzyme
VRPNLLFLLADDLRFDCLGFMGHPLVKTPNLDALARSGRVFSNAFVTTSICVASRANFLTGQWTARNGVVEFTDRLSDDAWEQTYPARLRAAGYTTGFVGKFGIGDESYVRSCASRFDYWRGRPGQGGPDYIEPDGMHTTARMGEDCLEFLRTQTPARPFCLSVSFNAPHARDGKPREFTPDPRDEALYSSDPIPRPVLATDEAFSRLPDSVKTSEARRRWKARFATEEKRQATVRDYLRLVTGIDREVGRLVATLKERGLYDSTVIVFTSDNGFALGERGLADKWFAFEEDIRVPLLVVGPGVKPGRSGAMALSVDLAPTLLALAGVPAPETMQGKSLTPILSSGRTPRGWRRDFYYEHRTRADIIPPCEAVRGERYKYVRWIEPGGREELYDLKNDPQEARNLAPDPRRGKLLEQYRSRCRTLAQEAASSPAT